MWFAGQMLIWQDSAHDMRLYEMKRLFSFFFWFFFFLHILIPFGFFVLTLFDFVFPSFDYWHHAFVQSLLVFIGIFIFCCYLYLQTMYYALLVNVQNKENIEQ